jgi:type IV pilus assembly protein PilN
MMIHINLLPVRAVKKREMGRQVLVVGAVVLVAAGFANFAWYSSRNDVQESQAARITETNRKIKELEKVIGEVNDINKRKKEVESKLAVLDDLRKRRSGPVRMMDALAIATPKKVWLEGFDEKGGAVKINGTAFSHDDVADFMRNLGDVVWTPKGIGRLLEQKRDAKTSRVELVSSDGAIEEFPVAQVGPFFQNVDLKKAEQKGGAGAETPLVTFQILLHANYAI